MAKRNKRARQTPAVRAAHPVQTPAEAGHQATSALLGACEQGKEAFHAKRFADQEQRQSIAKVISAAKGLREFDFYIPDPEPDLIIPGR